MTTPDRKTMICSCHDVTLGQLADYIREHKVEKWRTIVEDREFLCGDTCEQCHEEGYNNDGPSLAMAAGMARRGMI